MNENNVGENGSCPVSPKSKEELSESHHQTTAAVPDQQAAFESGENDKKVEASVQQEEVLKKEPIFKEEVRKETKAITPNELVLQKWLAGHNRRSPNVQTSTLDGKTVIIMNSLMSGNQKTTSSTAAVNYGAIVVESAGQCVLFYDRLGETSKMFAGAFMIDEKCFCNTYDVVGHIAEIMPIDTFLDFYGENYKGSYYVEKLYLICYQSLHSPPLNEW